MARRTTQRIKTNAVGPVPQNREQAREYILRIEATMNDQIQKIKDKYQALAAPHAEQITELSKGVQTWCEAHRDELTNGGRRKSADLGAGEVQWRTRPPKVSLRNIPGVIEGLKSLGLKQFLRTKEEVNKEAILADPEAAQNVKGITITQGEDFVIKPHESELEEIA